MSEQRGWDGTFGSVKRDTFPDMATLAIPVFGPDAPKFLMVGMRYHDGRLSQSLMTNDEWDALSEEKREALTVDPSWEWKPLNPFPTRLHKMLEAQAQLSKKENKP